MKEDRHCVTCVNWFPTKSSATPTPGTLVATSGECHRYAPRPLLADRDAIKCPVLFWPMTGASDVCGEWYYGGLRAGGETEPEKPASEPGRCSPFEESLP